MSNFQYFRINGVVTSEEKLTAQQLAGHPAVAEAEGIFIRDESISYEDSEKAISFLRVICNACRAKVFAKVRAAKQEDVKKILYAGCTHAVVELSETAGEAYLQDVSARFGRDKIIALVKDEQAAALFTPAVEKLVCAVIVPSADLVRTEIPVFVLDEAEGLLHVNAQIGGSALVHYVPWAELKKNGDGLVPCIVQDVANDEVLMMAWMNEEAYEMTLQTGRMTYFSRSRQELWIKGETSGHFQYLKSLAVDCDSDTLLAKVEQIGAACHTGHRSCFFTDILKEDTLHHSPGRVFQDVYDIILDRKAHPKEGSYTNYLFEKGIDKILKKVGEEATEIVIAAKNPDKEEVKYEIADFLYHAMVLMAEKGVTWEEITTELARR